MTNDTSQQDTAVQAVETGEGSQGDIIDGTWINPAIPADDPRRNRESSQVTYTLADTRPSFVRMIFGSFVILTEEVSERVIVSDDDVSSNELVQAAINQAANQQEALDRRPFADLRYMTIGLVGGAADALHGGSGRAGDLTDAAARTAGRIIGPIWNSFLFAPLHRPAMRIEQAGEDKVNEWIRRGRVEEVRSRALAEVSINNFVEESVSDLTQNEQIQVIVQEVIASQSTSLITELLEEARERIISLDILFLSKLRQEPVAAPPFRDRYVQELPNRRAIYQRQDLRQSLAGTYAGPLTRLVAFLIDVTLLLLVVGLSSAFVSSTLSLFGLTDAVNNFLTSGRLVATLALIGIGLYNFAIISAYFVIGWSLTGSTFGDALMGIRVVNRDGERVSFGRGIMRLVGAYVSALVLFIGFIWALFDNRRQGWHDKFGGTFVVFDWPAVPEEEFLRDQVMLTLDS